MNLAVVIDSGGREARERGKKAVRHAAKASNTTGPCRTCMKRWVDWNSPLLQ